MENYAEKVTLHSRQSLRLSAKVRDYILRHRMLDRAQKVIVAVSGGPDSVALLHLLAGLGTQWKLSLVVAHLNHRLRAEESDRDEAFVSALAGQLQLPAVIGQCDVAALAAQRRVGLEEAGRDARYCFLEETRKAQRADCVALGHHRDDQAETVLHRLLRGCGLRGLEGMAPVRGDRFIRPLLGVSRAEILGYLRAGELSWREDASNQDPRFLRNRIRQELLPLLERDFNPRIRRALAQLADLVRADNGLLEELAGCEFAARSGDASQRHSWPVGDLLALPLSLRSRVVRMALESLSGAGFSARHVQQVLDLARPGRSGSRSRLPGGILAWRQFEELVLAPEPPAARPFELRLEVPGEVTSPDGGWTLVARRCRSERPGGGGRGHQAIVGFAEPPLHLTVRSARPGDQYRLAHGRSLKRLWNDARVPLEVRPQIPLLFEGRELIWIPGFPPAGNRTNTAGSNTVVRVSLACRKGSVLDRWLAGR